MKRNGCEYDFAGGVSDTDADGLLKTVQQFATDAEAWIATNYPKLAESPDCTARPLKSAMRHRRSLENLRRVNR